MENNENFEICSACGGKCCNNLPGNAHPQDFGFDTMSEDQIREELTAMFKSGNWQIDWWENYSTEEGNDGHKGIFIRPTTKKGRGSIYHGAWDREGCTFHSNKGCDLAFNQRPFDCKELVPRKSKCLIPFTEEERHPKLVAIEKWWPYEDLITQVASDLGEDGAPEHDPDDLFGGLFGMLSRF